MRPKKMHENLIGAGRLLGSRTSVISGDYRALLEVAGPGDLVYMDPPYQGVSTGRDARYFQQLDVDEFISDLERLNLRGVPFVLSYDGSCGDREYGKALPDHLELSRIAVHAGPSSQATLNGKSAQTVESLYLSRGLCPVVTGANVTFSLESARAELSLPL